MTGDILTPQTTWSQYTTEIYLTGKHPINGSYDHRVVEARAREATKDNHCEFAHTILRIASIDKKSVISCLYVYVWQRRDWEHVS